MNQTNLIKNANEVQVKLCCGCGIVNLTVGPVMLRMTKQVMEELAESFNGVVEALNEKTAPALIEAEPVRESSHEMGKIYHFADGKFFA